jgi:LacI family transcriptional regulator
VRERIQSGEWHKWLPGEHDLCAQFHVARMTLRAALQELQRAGFVRSSQGKRREIVARRSGAAPARSGRVLLLTPMPLPLLAPFHALLINALRDELDRAGFHLEIHAERGPYGRGWSLNLERLMEQLRPAGCVLVASTEKMQLWFSRQRRPCVIVGSRHPGVELPSVDKAHRAACRHAVGLFLARGHRHLALLNPASGLAGDLESEEGFREGALQSKHGDVEASVVRHDGTVADICDKLHALFRRRDRPTGLLVSRSVNVLTVMGLAMRSGLRLPEDLALISRDHEPFLENMVPSVALYVVSPETMAHRISAAVLELAQSGFVSASNYQIMPEFREGETLGPTLVQSPGSEKSAADSPHA